MENMLKPDDFISSSSYSHYKELLKENEQLKKECGGLRAIIYADKFGVEIMAQRMLNAELLEAINGLLTEISPAYNFDLRQGPESVQKALNVKAKAEGK